MHSSLIKTCMVCFAWHLFFIASPAWAAEKEAPKKAEEAKPEVVKDEPKVEKVLIPDWLREGEHRLIVDGKDVDVSGKDVDVKPSLDPVTVELYDRRGRLVHFGRDYYDAEIFNSIRARAFRLEFMLGSVTPSDDDEWRRIFLTGDRFQIGGNFEWFWSSLGLASSLVFQSQSNQLSEDVIASYSAFTMNLDLIYEIAPFRHARNYFRKVSLVPLLGLGFTGHRLRIADDVVSESDSDKSISYRTGVAVKLPLANNFSMQVRYLLIKQTINFDKFSTKIDQFEHGLTLGGAYAL